MPAAQPTIQLALVDDHKLFRKGLISLIEMAGKEYTVILEADNGKELISKIKPALLPDIILMDINMPGMNGYETMNWLQQNHPHIPVLVVSMIEKEETIVKMLKMGVKGYLSKDVEPNELKQALEAVLKKGYYYTDFITGKLIHSLQNNGNNKNNSQHNYELSDREKDFIKLACSELTYNEIAAQMFLSPKTIDGYRNNLFEKLNVKSRVGLVLFAIRNGYFEL
jgi:two-component system, NarL family, invasion response regulator UvrY